MTAFSKIVRIDNTLRPYQQQAKEKIFTAWDEYDNVMFQMPTGTGKTRLFTSIISDIKSWGILNAIDTKILIIAHRVELIEQISESLEKYRIPHGIIAGGKERDLRQQVQVASIQTITHHSNLGAAQALNINFIIIDEAHHSMANSYKKLWSMYDGAKKLGVTATPWRMNDSGFQPLYDILIPSKSVREFIEDGWLSSYNYYSIKDTSKIQHDIDSITEFDIEGDYKVSALERVIDNVQIRAQLLDSYKKYANGKKGIIYSISRNHSDHICAEFKEAGINIVRIDSKTPKDERQLYVKRFRNGLIDIIVNVDVFSEGFDCPDIEFVQLARPTKSLVKYLQQVGRGLRPTDSKACCLILDNVGLHISFGLPDAEHEWEKHFAGNTKLKKKSSNSGSNQSASGATNEQSFEEGNDELVLIYEANISNNKSVKEDAIRLSDEDIKLLQTLYVDKHCTIDMLVAIFNVTEDCIINTLKELNILIDSQ